MPGQIGKTSSPTGTVEKKRLFQASLRDWLRYRQTPAFKRRAIFKISLRDAAFSVVQKLRCDLVAAGGANDVEMDGAAAAHGKLDAGVELSGDDNEMKAKVSKARARLLSLYSRRFIC
jgi:hypothetical protein